MKLPSYEKISILADSAKYDVSCSSSGGESNYKNGQIGCNSSSGICHTFTEDGRCVSLLKVLFSNVCIYDCSYCINRVSNDIKRASFSPIELAELTINFYKRNYIEGLFLSSGIVGSEDNTMKLLIETIKILRFEYKFGGYIHLKLIPGASEYLIEEGCRLATRVSSNIELPNANSLKLLAPNKTKEKILHPLKLARDITEDLKFNGRLSMYKYWADSDPNLQSSRDSMQGRRPGDSALYVERAYVDWVMKEGEIPLILTLGRQPSSDGPSHNFKDNTVRKSTYSALAFDGAADGAVLTANLAKSTGMENNAFRIAYGKGYQAHENTYPTNLNFTGSDLNTTSGANLEDTTIIGFFLDGAIPTISNTLVQLGYVTMSDLVFTDMSTGNVNKMGSNENLGDFAIYGVMAEGTNLFDSGLDLFAHYGISKASPNGRFVGGYGLNSSDTNGDGVADKAEEDGSAYWLGFRYTIPNNLGKFGYEYNHGSKGWFNMTVGSNSLTNKLATRGDAHEIYYLYELNRYAHLKAGYQMIDYEYTGSGDYRGAPLSIAEALAANTNPIDELSNIYFSFNILF